MRALNVNWDKVLNVCLILLATVGIYMCGWVNGHISANEFVESYPVKEYIYIEKKCEKEHIEDVIEEDASQNAPIEPVEPVEWPKLYTDEDAVALAKTFYGEARGVKDNGIVSGKCQIAAVGWCILNRYDAGFERSIIDVIVADDQFHGYKASFPVWDELLELAYDVLDRWNAEQHGETDVGRVLPEEYMWFSGDGEYNHFRDSWRGGNKWDWSLGDPYAS